MERYASLAPYGQHRGPARTDAAATSSQVRGLPAEDSRPKATVEQKPASSQNPPTSPASANRYRLSRNGGDFLLTTRRDGDGLGEDEEEVGEYTSVAEARQALPSELAFYVFENSSSGAVEMRQARDLAHGMALDDSFDRVRIFASQDDAERYAKGKSGARK